MNLDTPVEADDFACLVDWLELTALLSAERVARLDLVADALDIGADTEPNDFGDQDAKLEELANDLSEEVKSRINILGDQVYPFRISANGESVSIVGDLSYGSIAYIISLVISHSWSNGKLLPPSKLTDAEQRQGREIFEIIGNDCRNWHDKRARISSGFEPKGCERSVGKGCSYLQPSWRGRGKS